MTTWREAELRELALDNESGAPHFDTFSAHRERLTRLARHAADSAPAGRLCVLGAGNANDLDLAALAETYREIHLVDVDGDALSRAVARQPASVQAVVRRHASVDLSGMLDKIERWREFRVTPEELFRHPEATAAGVEETLGTTFDAVLSCCVLTQMQLSVVRGFGDRHRLFSAVTQTLALTHLRTLHRLTRPGAQAILATDLTSSQLRPIEAPSSADRRPLVDEVLACGQAFYVADPTRLRAIVGDDPVLQRDVVPSMPLDAWVWQNGPEHRLLVYAMGLRRRALS